MKINILLIILILLFQIIKNKSIKLLLNKLQYIFCIEKD